MNNELTNEQLYSLCIQYEIERRRIMNLASDGDKMAIIDVIDQMNKHKPSIELLKLRDKYIYKDISKLDIKKDIQLINNIKELYSKS